MKVILGREKRLSQILHRRTYLAYCNGKGYVNTHLLVSLSSFLLFRLSYHVLVVLP